MRILIWDPWNKGNKWREFGLRVQWKGIVSPRKRFVLSTPCALGPMGWFTRDSAASAKLRQDECLVPSLFLRFHNTAKIMGTWCWGGVKGARKRNHDLVHHKRMSTYESAPKRIKLLYICSEVVPMVHSKSLPPLLTSIQRQSCHKDAMQR